MLRIRLAVLTLVILVLSACHSGSGSGSSEPDPAPLTPTVNLSPAPSPVQGGDTVHLHADITNATSIQWSQVSGTSVTLTDATTGNPSFTAPGVCSPDTLTFELQVSPATSGTTLPTVDVVVNPIGLSVNAGQDQLVNEGAAVTLHASSTPNTGVTFAWSQFSGQTVTINNGKTANPTFVANIPYNPGLVPGSGTQTSFAGDLAFRVTATQTATGCTTTDEVEVKVNAPVPAPVVTIPLSASAGQDQVVSLNHLVHLSTVASGGVSIGGASGAAGYTYLWTQTNTGIGPTATLNNANTANPDFTPTDAGRYVFEVTATDDNSDTTTDSVVIDVTENLQVNIASSGSLPAGKNLSLHPVVTGGSGNFSYQWATDKTVTYVTGSATDANPVVTYNPTATEQVTFTLTVTDNSVSPAVSASAKKTTTFLVPLPVSSVNAGADKTVLPGHTVSLHALATPTIGVHYKWTGPAGITITDAGSPNAVFTAPTTEGDYVFTATASTKANSVTDTVTISVQAPVTSNAGTDKTVTEGDTIHLHGAGAHGSGTYTYLWSVTNPAGGGTFDDATSNNPLFTPGKAGVVYTLQLTVTDSGTNTPVNDTVDITVQETMTVDAGPDRTVKPGDSVTLHAVADKPGASFLWDETAPGTGITINNDTTANADFTAPVTQQGYPFEATASKALTVTATDGVTITVQDSVSTNAGQDKTVVKGHLVHLHGSAAHGIPTYTYLWSTINAPETVTFSSATSDNPSFTPNTAGSYKLDLQVTDSTGGTPQVVHDTVTITVVEALTVNAGADQNVKAGTTVQLRPTHSGGVGAFTYAWTLPAGVSLENGTTVNDQDIDVTYNPATTDHKTLTLAVTDTGDGNITVSDSVDLTFSVATAAAPVAPSSRFATPVTNPVIAAALAAGCPGELVEQWSSGAPTGKCVPSKFTVADGCAVNNKKERNTPAGAIFKAYQCGEGKPGQPPTQICEQPIPKPVTACGANELPYIKVTNTDSGARTLKMGCMSLPQCYQDWYNNSADKDSCQEFDPKNIEKLSIECTFCCVGSNCNNFSKANAKGCPVTPGSLWTGQ